MNNSLDRLIDGMIATLRGEVIPHVATEFARGQAFGVIYMLESIRRRAAWSPAFVGAQIASLDALADALKHADLPPDAPQVPPVGHDNVDASGLECARDSGDAAVTALLQWLAGMPADSFPIARAALRRHVSDRLRHEIATSARPMFAEMSLGRENI